MTTIDRVADFVRNRGANVSILRGEIRGTMPNGSSLRIFVRGAAIVQEIDLSPRAFVSVAHLCDSWML